jgi:hypothetical protein
MNNAASIVVHGRRDRDEQWVNKWASEAALWVFACSDLQIAYHLLAIRNGLQSMVSIDLILLLYAAIASHCNNHAAAISVSLDEIL